MNEKMGLVGYNSASDESGLKPYSDSTNELIDIEVRKVVDECY